MGAPQQTSTLEFDTTSLGRLSRSRRRSVGRPGKAAPPAAHTWKQPHSLLCSCAQRRTLRHTSSWCFFSLLGLFFLISSAYHCSSFPSCLQQPRSATTAAKTSGSWREHGWIAVIALFELVSICRSVFTAQLKEEVCTSELAPVSCSGSLSWRRA